MSDDLRTRIAAAVTDYLHGVAFIDTGDLADAVIRELGLPPTWGRPSFDNGSTDD